MVSSAFKMSEKERCILSCAELLADASASMISNISGYRTHTVRYCLEKARESGLLSRRCFVNLFRLGKSQYELFFSLNQEDAITRERFVNYLLSSDKISWVGELGGDFQYAINFCAQNMLELSAFLDRIPPECGQLIDRKQLLARQGLWYFGNKYLSTKKRPVEALRYTFSDSTAAIDELDHKILLGLIEPNPTSRRQLAHQLGIPLSTMELRIDRLQRNGVIVGYYNHIQPADVARQGHLLLISTHGFSEELTKSFLRFCAEHPTVVVLVRTLGAWDYEIAAEVNSQMELNLLIQGLQQQFGENISDLQILASFNYLKISEYPFMNFATQTVVQRSH